MLTIHKDSRKLISRTVAPRPKRSSPSKENNHPNQEVRDDSRYKRNHKNACRTKVCEFLEYRSERKQKLKNPSMWLISKTYLKKLEQVQNRLNIVQEEPIKERKVSWSEEAEFVVFNVRKSSASISDSQRCTYSLD